MLILIVGIPAALVIGSAIFAAHSARGGRQAPVRRPHVLWGAILAVAGLVLTVSAARSAQEYPWYRDEDLIMAAFLVTVGGALLLIGCGPLISLPLEILGRHTARLPSPFRLAARELTGGRSRTAPAIATTMSATAIAIAVTIAAVAATAQEKVSYPPEAAPGPFWCILRRKTRRPYARPCSGNFPAYP